MTQFVRNLESIGLLPTGVAPIATVIEVPAPPYPDGITVDVPLTFGGLIYFLDIPSVTMGNLEVTINFTNLDALHGNNFLLQIKYTGFSDVTNPTISFNLDGTPASFSQFPNADTDTIVANIVVNADTVYLSSSTPSQKQ